MIQALNCTQFQATIGLSVYPLGFGVVPLFTAPFSEEIGRRPLYLGSIVGFILMHLMVAQYEFHLLIFKSVSSYRRRGHHQGEEYSDRNHRASPGWSVWIDRRHHGRRLYR